MENGIIDRNATRLDRIEDKIDKLSDAMIDLARAEEKLINFERSNQQLLARVDKTFLQLNHRMDELTKNAEKTHDMSLKNAQTVKLINRAAAILFTALVGVVIKLYFVATAVVV